MIPQIIDRRAVALFVFGSDQAKNQQHERQRIDDASAQTPPVVVIGGHTLEDVGHLLP